MINSLQRFLFRWKYAVLIIFVILGLAAVFSFQTNRWVPDFALSFSDLIDQQIQAKISFRSVHYSFPNKVIFENADVRGVDGKMPILQAARVVMGFSIPLLSPRISLNSVLIEGMTVNFPGLKNYLGLYNTRIFALAKKAHQGTLRLLIPKGYIYPAGYGKGQAFTFNAELNLDHGRLTAGGSWNYKRTYNFSVKGNIRSGEFDLDKFSLENSRSSMNLWGSWRHGIIDWKGFIFYDKFYVLDIDGNMDMRPDEVTLNRLFFTIDGDGISAKGHFSRTYPYKSDVHLSFRRLPQHVTVQRPLKNINLHLRSIGNPRGVDMSGMADFYFLFDAGSPTALQAAHMDFHDLHARLVNGNIVKFKVKQMQNTLSVQNHRHKVLLEDVLASLNFSKPFQKDFALSAALYGGHAYSRALLNTLSVPWQISSRETFKGLDISLLSGDFPLLKQCHGLLSGAFNLQASRDIGLAGYFRLINADFNGSNFQKWLVGTLQMPSLDHVSGALLTGRLKIQGKNRMFDHLRLDAIDFVSDGFFHLDEDNLVNSRISIRFSKTLLQESPIGRHIMGLVHGAWALPFEFSLSGNLARTNFQWDNSPLKQQVHQHIFTFYEKMIDRRIDAHPYYNVATPSESVSPG